MKGKNVAKSTTVSVKAAVGRIARTAPDGPFVPDDQFVTIERTRYVSRLIEVHGDLIVEPKAQPVPVPEPTPTTQADDQRAKMKKDK